MAFEIGAVTGPGGELGTDHEELALQLEQPFRAGRFDRERPGQSER